MAWLNIVGSLGLLVGVLYTVNGLGRHWGLASEVQRKLVHTGLGLYALSFPWLFSTAWEVAVLGAAAMLLLLLVRWWPVWRGHLGQALHGVARVSWGEMYFTLAIVLLFALSVGQPVLYVLPLLILALSDAAAALVGAAYGQQHFRVASGQKSLEGSAVFFITAWLLAQGTLWALTDLPCAERLALAGILALLGTLVEAASWRGLDNLFVPLGLFLLTERLLAGSAWALLPAVGVFLGLLFLSLAFQRRLGRDPHPPIAVLTAGFFIWLVGGVNVIAPLAVLGLQGYLTDPRAAADATLSRVLGVISVALFWFMLERLTGYDTRLLYHLSFAVYGLVLVGAAVRSRSSGGDG